MLLKTQWGKYINLDNVETIEAHRRAYSPVTIYATTGRGTGYALVNTNTRPEAEEIISDLADALDAGATLFDFSDFRPEEIVEPEPEPWRGRAEFEKTRETRKQKQAATWGRRVERDNGGALDWNNYIETDTNQPRGFSRAEVMGVNNMDPEEFERRRGEIVERIAAGTDIIKCDYPTDARGVILQQSGDAIDRPATWQKIYMENIEAGGGVNINLESYNEATGIKSCDCLGRYATMEAPRIFRELRDKIENEAELIKMP